jgi:hypothetical protein
MSRLASHMPSGSHDQVTQYFYGITSGGRAGKRHHLQLVCSPKLVPSDMGVANGPLGPEGTLDERQEAHSRADHRQAA